MKVVKRRYIRVSDVVKEFEKLLDAKLEPLRESIERLDKNYEKIVTIIAQQARHEEIVRNLQKGLDDANKDIDTLYKRSRENEQLGENKLWEITKLFITALVSAILTAVGIKQFGG